MLPGSHTVTYRDGGLVWTDENGESTVKVKEEEIVLVAGPSQDSQPGYLVFGLAETTDDEDPARPYRLVSLRAADLPVELLDKHLLGNVPEALQGRPDHKLNVVISTRSGVGRAQHFYDDVLQPLLAVLGWGPEIPTPTPDPVGSQYNLVVTKSSHSVGSSPSACSRLLLLRRLPLRRTSSC